MRTTATTRHGDALTVFDDARRLRWQRPDIERWVPLDVWPNASERREVHRQLALGLPLLVILEAAQTVVPILAEELAAAGPTVLARVADSNPELVHVHLPALDWLPDDLRQRGLAFLEASAARWTQIPRPLRPPLVLDEGDATAPHVRFAHRLRSDGSLDNHLVAIVEHVFGPVRAAVAAN